MGNQAMNVANSMVRAASPVTTEKQEKEVNHLKQKIQRHNLEINGVVFEGGGAKVMAYVGAVEVNQIRIILLSMLIVMLQCTNYFI